MKHKSRIYILLYIFIFLFILLVFRLFLLQILQHKFFEKKSQEQRTRVIDLAAQRGEIYDRNGNILVTSIDTYSVYKHKQGWLARKLTYEKAQGLKDKDSQNISVLKEKKRVYPKNRLAAQIIGFVGIDNQGLSGIELSYNDYLKGKEGRLITEGDPTGKELYGALRELEAGEDGMSLTLTIDENIQYVCEREIEKQIKKSKAVSGMCIVMDIKTGEILGLASKPDFNPNAYSKAGKKLWHPRVLDPYEPGSTFKVVTTAAGLAEEVISLNTTLKALDTIKVGGRVIGNSHDVKWSGKKITLSRMLEESINTGAVQVGLKLGPEKFYNRIRSFGFGRRTGVGLWGESNGIVRHWKSWYKPDIAMITFGQSIAVTPLQLLSVVAAFANDGVRLKPILVKKIESLDGHFVKVFKQEDEKRILSSKVAGEIKELMQNVVVEGTGKAAKIEGFGVCGKTGTAQKAIPGGRGYMKGHYIASFIGFAPYKDPQIAALVIVDDPKGSYWGATVCGPVFRNVMAYTLRYLNITPDRII
jgi:stage V sporulation protein D (sporulation-specific penicillin-binding protein)